VEKERKKEKKFPDKKKISYKRLIISCKKILKYFF